MSNARILADLMGTSTTVGASALPAGSVLQVVQAVKTDIQTIPDATYTAITDLSGSITPLSTNSKILVELAISVGVHGSNEGMHIRLYRGGSVISGALGDASGSRDTAWIHVGPFATTGQASASAMYLDSPASTSAQTYAIYARSHSSSYPSYINRSETDTDSTYHSRTTSTLTLMEIAG